MLNTPTLRRLLPRLGLLLALAPFLLLCAFDQPFFDDFRNGTWMRAHGVWGVQVWLFRTWTGRFTTTFIMTVLNPVAYGWLGGVKLVAAALFAAQWASLTHLLRALRRLPLGLDLTRAQAGWAAALVLVLFCNAAPAPFSFLYWYSGAIVYQLPLIALLNFAALAVRVGWGGPTHRWRWAALVALALALALTGNELTLVQAVPLLAVLALNLPEAARPQLALWLLIGALATTVAALAPGNWARAAAMAPPTDPYHAWRWLVLMPRAALSMALFLLRPLVALSTLAAGTVGWWAGRQSTAATPATLAASPGSLLTRQHWLAVLAAYGALNFSGFVLFRYLTVGAPLLRAQNELLLVLLLSTGLLGWLAGRQQRLSRARAANLGTRPHPQPPEPQLLRPLPSLVGQLLLAALLATGHVPEAWRELASSAAPYDAQMRARFAALRAAHLAGTPRVVLPPLRLPYGHVLVPLSRFSRDIEFDLDLTNGCEGNINGVMENYFAVPNVCCDPAAPDLPPAP